MQEAGKSSAVHSKTKGRSGGATVILRKVESARQIEVTIVVRAR
jgi:hypothetical protein